MALAFSPSPAKVSAQVIDGSVPIAPADYQKLLGTGFATDWFKTNTLGKLYTPMSLSQTMTDLDVAGYSNLRLRSQADLWGFADADPANFVAATSIDQVKMDAYLAELDVVLDASLASGITPTISWIHHNAEGRANSDDGDNFVQWWSAVANHTRDRSHLLSFNLMTEVGKQDPDGDGVNGVFDSAATWNDWTRRAISAIRNTGGNSAQRNIIITSPRNTRADSFSDIAADILAEDQILLEYHTYAAGATSSGRTQWSGTGTVEDRARLIDRLDDIEAFSAANEVPIYWGAWMPMDNKESTLSQEEVDAFAYFFAEELAKRDIPWSMNKLRNYYDAENNIWLEQTEFGTADGTGMLINVEQALASAAAGHAAGATSVPEPSSMVVICLMFAMAATRRFRG